MKPDLVRTDDNWENWRMEDLMKHLQGWLKRNRTEEQPGTIRENQKKERHWYTAKGDDKSPPDKTKATPVCLYCKQGHWGDHCETYKTLESIRKFLADNRLCYNCGRAGTLVIIVEAVAVSNAKGGITQAFVTKMTTLYSLCIHRQPRRHSQL